jgi:Fic family protein
MPKIFSKDKQDALIDAISLFPDGGTSAQINKALSLPLLRRTLQRQLTRLVQNGDVLAEGQSRARKYRLKPLEKELLSFHAKGKSEQQAESFIPCSDTSREIQRIISLPTQGRKPVAYQRIFLDEYQPNVTNYLSAALCDHLLKLGKTDGPRPSGTYALQIYGRLLIDLSWNSSRLEGNTYSLLETERLLELSEVAEGKNLQEAQMIINHKAAIEFLMELADDVGINRYTLLNLHALLSNNLLPNPEGCGRLRKIPVGINETVYQPTAIPHLIEECFQKVIDKARAIDNPFEQAFFLMVHIPYLQPFEDVNKRVSRLAANIPLIRCNLCPLSFVDVPSQIYIDGNLGVYELNRVDLLRDVFAWAYERSCLLYSTTRQTLGEPDPFRMRYRKLIYETVTEVVREQMNKKAAIKVIQQKADQLHPQKEKERFIQAVEAELRGLHEGNIARYRLRPAEYESWQNHWS